MRQCLGQLACVAQHITGDFVQLRTHDIGHIRTLSQFEGVEQVRQLRRLIRIAQALRRKRDFFGQQIRRGATVAADRHRQAIRHRVTGDFQRPGDVIRIETPQHDGHDNVILRAFAVREDTSHPRQIGREQLTLFVGLAFGGSDLF
ncbi:hypothetical protein D3C80_1773610 [compost metagenome]